mmetsp:Transcript_23122/g.59068  ORF Transcript_23122/g.59068 Transcript_23122/m.59068 type:complete len:246 (+) Transcript_23122:266-1003(+)
MPEDAQPARPDISCIGTRHRPCCAINPCPCPCLLARVCSCTDMPPARLHLSCWLHVAVHSDVPLLHAVLHTPRLGPRACGCCDHAIRPGCWRPGVRRVPEQREGAPLAPDQHRVLRVLNQPAYEGRVQAWSHVHPDQLMCLQRITDGGQQLWVRPCLAYPHAHKGAISCQPLCTLPQPRRISWSQRALAPLTPAQYVDIPWVTLHTAWYEVVIITIIRVVICLVWRSFGSDMPMWAYFIALRLIC